MSSTVHCCESQASFVTLNIASNLLSVHVGDVVGAPEIENVPAEVSEPSLGAISGNCTIGISRVLQNLVFALELYIDPLRSILKGSVVDIITAQIPFS